jgi:hypothetical protein
MGMFDYVLADFRCPYCKYIVTIETMKKSARAGETDSWQTKDLSCSLHIIKVGDKIKLYSMHIGKGFLNIHHVCPKCDKLVSARIYIKNYMLTNKKRYEV